MKENKKVRKQELGQESDKEKKTLFFSWSLSWSSSCFLSFFLVSWSLSWSSSSFLSFFLFFLIAFLVEFLFSCFLTFLFSFIHKFPPQLSSFILCTSYIIHFKLHLLKKYWKLHETFLFIMCMAIGPKRSKLNLFSSN